MKENISEYGINVQENGAIRLFQALNNEELAANDRVSPDKMSKSEQRQMRATLYRLMRKTPPRIDQ